MSYDDWKTHDPDDDRCEFCGVYPRECRGIRENEGRGMSNESAVPASPLKG